MPYWAIYETSILIYYNISYCFSIIYLFVLVHKKLVVTFSMKKRIIIVLEFCCWWSVGQWPIDVLIYGCHFASANSLSDFGADGALPLTHIAIVVNGANLTPQEEETIKRVRHITITYSWKSEEFDTISFAILLVL